MTLVEELRDYMRKHSETKTRIADRHSVAIIGETHAPLLSGDGGAARTETSVRLILELLQDARYRYYASEHFFNAGPVRRGLRRFLRDGKRPPELDDPAAVSRDDPDIEAIASRVLLNRHRLVVDFLRRNPRYVLAIGSASGRGRDQRLAQHFLEEAADRGLGPGTHGVCLLGASHAARAAADGASPTTRMIIEKQGFRCVSIRALSDFVNASGVPDDLVVSLQTPLDNITQGDIIRLTSLVGTTPVTIPTDKGAAGRPSPFRKVTFGLSKRSVAEQFEYILLQKA